MINQWNIAVSLWKSWKFVSCNPMRPTLGENLKVIICNIIYGSFHTKKSHTAIEKWKITFKNLHFTGIIDHNDGHPCYILKGSCHLYYAMKMHMGMAILVGSTHWSSYEIGLFVKGFFKFVMLLVYHFSHKPLLIRGIHAIGFQFLSLFTFSIISFKVLSKLHGWLII